MAMCRNRRECAQSVMARGCYTLYILKYSGCDTQATN